MSDEKSDAPESTSWIGRHRRTLLIGGPVIAAVIAFFFYLTGGRYVSTDDAYVQSGRVEVSTNIPGRVVEVDVHDNQIVHKGDVLFKLDPASYQVALDDAEAQLEAARRKVPAMQAVYRQHLADQNTAQASVAYEQQEFARQTKLQASGISSRSQLEQVTKDLATARGELAAAGQESASALADLGSDPNAPVESQPSVRQAEAALARAKLNMSYTEIHAPIDGVVTKVEMLQVGDYINAASPQFALVSSTDVWVEANFKETDLTYMREGQHATFAIDAYPGHKFTGVVQSTSPGTGSSFSLLPPENSSGNWVKVVQRLPVRLTIDPPSADTPLATGMSVTAKVDTQHHRSLAFWKP